MFFTHISQMMTKGVDLTLVMRKTADGQMTVSLMPKSTSLKDSAQNHLVPLTLNGTPSELDAGFFAAAMQPIQRVTGLIVNLAEFEKQADKAAADSRAKSTKEKESKEAKDKRERYEKHMKKAEEQMTAKDYDGAILSLQQARLLATEEQTTKIDEKIASAKAIRSQGSLFEVPAAPSAPVTPAAAPAQPASPAPQSIAQAGAMPAAAPLSQQNPVQPAPSPQTLPLQPAALPRPQQAAPQPVATPNPAGGYLQQPLPPMPQYGQSYPGIDPLGMQTYDNPDNPPTYRPDEYAEYVDFPQSMIARTPGAATNTGVM